MAAKWKKLLEAVAPKIGLAIGGPMGGLAASVALEALGLDGAGGERELRKAVADMTPDQYVKLHNADLDFQERCMELEVEESKIHQKDRASARDMRMASGRWTADILAFVTVFGFFAVLASFFFVGGNLDPAIKDPLLILIGVLSASFKDIYQFFFGSSRGSKEKNNVIRDIKKGDG